MARLSLFALLLALAVGVAGIGCAQGGPAMQEREMPFETLTRGTHSGIVEARYQVLRDAREWDTLWHAHSAVRLPAPPAPAIDLARHMVIALFLGQRPTGGYGIEVLRLIDDGTHVVVEYRISEPAPGMLLTQALTQPHHLILAPRSTRPVVFREASGP